MKQETIKYHTAALEYLESYYKHYAYESYYFGKPFMESLLNEGKKIVRESRLGTQDQENALVALCFWISGMCNFAVADDTWKKLLKDFGRQVDYPEEELMKVETFINRALNLEEPQTDMEKAMSDATNYRFATDDMDDLIIHGSYLKEEFNRRSAKHFTELDTLSVLKQHFVKCNFHTDYAQQKLSPCKEKFFDILNKRIEKLQARVKQPSKEVKASLTFSDKETEDLFKIAFRNYSNLVSVADSKAGLLINVNSIIISVVIAFSMGHMEEYHYLTLPAFILLGVSLITILLSILASRPQRNHSIQDKSSKSYQTFFFGSFDLVGNEFSKADWNNYAAELDAMLKGGKEKVYDEMYREAFNVRKVLGKKFTYLSYAYWIFLIGLFVSIISFLIQLYQA